MKPETGLLAWKKQKANHFSMVRWGISIESCERLAQSLLVTDRPREAALESLQAQLNELRNARPDALSLLSDKMEKRRLRNMLPLRYPPSDADADADQATAMDTSS